MMTASARERWDRKYAAGEGPAHFEPRELLTNNRYRLTGGRALDVACGFGGNALYLASLGYEVDALDVSGVGLAQAQAEAARRGLQINFVQTDLTQWSVPTAHYDLIVVFFYLNRELMPKLAAGLRPGGLFLQCGRNAHYLATHPEFNLAFLLEPGELYRLTFDAGLDVLYFADGTPDRLHISEIIARRPA
jgi:2-polyprenyl-3-methyl-5-hydroxy-6-metoxy-1,4-benzoquinol methylase